MRLFRLRLRGMLLAAALSMAIACAPVDSPATPSSTLADPPAPAGRTLLAIYVLGSDLEDDMAPRNGVPDEEEGGSAAGVASRDLEAIRGALAALTPEARDNVDVLVGFGGARREGWRGLTILDGDQLVADGGDGRFGNHEAAVARHPGLDLGSPEGLETFLRQAESRAAASPRRMLVLWNHGASYAGLGPDTVTNSRLALGEIRQALVSTGFRADVLGFDACHMASLEVLRTVEGHAGVLVASEESEPSNGWDYAGLVGHLAHQPASSFAAVGRAVVDAYIDRPGDAAALTRTLSVVDVARSRAILGALDGLVGVLDRDLAEAYPKLLQAIGRTPKFGSFGLGNREIGIDARGFASAVASAHPPAAEAAGRLVSALDAGVLYSREAGGSPGATGLTICSPRNLTLIEAGGYGTANAASPAYWDFLHDVLRHAKGSLAVPEVASDEAAPGGRRIRLASATGLDEASSIRAERLSGGGERYALIERRPLSAETDGRFFLPAWDGRALFLAAGSARVRLAVTREPAVDGGRVALTVNGMPATLELRFNGQGEVASHWLEFIDADDAANPAPHRIERPLAAGDAVVVEGQVLDWDDRTSEKATSPSTMLDGPPRFEWAPLGGEAVYFLEAADLLDRFQASAPHAAGAEVTSSPR